MRCPSLRILTNTVPNLLNSRVTAASRALSSLGSGRLGCVSHGPRRKTREDSASLCDKHAGSGRVDPLGINTADVVAIQITLRPGASGPRQRTDGAAVAQGESRAHSAEIESGRSTPLLESFLENHRRRQEDITAGFLANLELGGPGTRECESGTKTPPKDSETYSTEVPRTTFANSEPPRPRRAWGGV